MISEQGVRRGEWQWHGVHGAGRRSAGVGGKGGTQVHMHAAGVRAFLRDWRAICSGAFIHSAAKLQNNPE